MATEKPDVEVKNTEQPILSIKLAFEGDKHFRSLDELDQWLKTERDAWSWLKDAAARDTQLTDVSTFQGLHDSEVQSMLGQWRAKPAAADNFRQQIKAWLDERYGAKRRALVSTSPAAQEVLRIAATDQIAAGYAVSYFMSRTLSVQSKSAFRGYHLGVMFDHGMHAASDAYAKSMQAVVDQIKEEQEALRKAAGRLEDDFKKRGKDLAHLRKEQQQAHDEAQATRAAEHQHLMEEHGKRIATVEKTFEAELELRAAVQYLKKGATIRYWVATGAGLAALGTGVGVVWLAVEIATTVFSDPAKVSAPQLGVAVLAATLAFWLLRILVRVFLSNLHLATDLGTRSTLVHTYLALIAQGGALKDEDRAQIVKMVFRPTTDGLVRDDAAPPSWLEVFTRTR